MTCCSLLLVLFPSISPSFFPQVTVKLLLSQLLVHRIVCSTQPTVQSLIVCVVKRMVLQVLLEVICTPRARVHSLISALSCVLGFSGYFEHNECMNVHDEFPNLSTSGGSSLYLSFVTGAGTFPVAIWKSSSVLHDLHGFPSLSYMIFLPDAPTAGFV